MLLEPAQVDHGVERVGEGDGAEHEQREPAGRQAPRPQAQPVARARGREGGAGEREEPQKELEAESVDRELLGPVRGGVGRQRARRRSRARRESRDQQGALPARVLHALQRTRQAATSLGSGARYVPCMNSLAPTFLVAMPQLLDPNFRRTVVLLVHHDEEGTFGIVLNRSTEITAPSLCATLDIAWHGEQAEPIGWGGPVQPQTGWVLFDDESDTAFGDDVKYVGEGVHFAGSLDVLRKIAVAPPQRLRLLLGYAGWGPGQLESELAEGAWLLAPVSREMVFDIDPSRMWEQVLRNMGIEPATLVATRGVH